MFARLRNSKSGNLLIELLLIVVGISIALWLEGWAENRQEAETEQTYLRGLQGDLSADLRTLNELISLNEAKAQQLQTLIPGLSALPTADRETQITAVFEPSGYHFFQPSDFTFVAMQESGDFRLLSDLQLQRDLLQLFRRYALIETLQDNFIQALDAEYIPLLMRGVDIATQRITEQTLTENQVFRNFFAFALQDTGQRLAEMEAAREEVTALMAAIDLQTQ